MFEVLTYIFVLVLVVPQLAGETLPATNLKRFIFNRDLFSMDCSIGINISNQVSFFISVFISFFISFYFHLFSFVYDEARILNMIYVRWSGAKRIKVWKNATFISV